MFICLLTSNRCSDIIMISKGRTHVREDREMKHLHIVNRFRFTVFMASVILIVSMLIGLLIGSFNASGSTKHSYETITVQSGDTLWTIAEQYKPDSQDIRDYIYEVCDRNDIKAGDLVQGMDIEIPVQK